MLKTERCTTPEALDALVDLALALWPGHSPSELTRELSGLLNHPEAALFLAERAGKAVGFAQCQLRRDYVEGATSSQVGYLEGIYVQPDYRRQGIARQLLAQCQGWAAEQGCREFASDCLLENRDSFAFHLQTGFQEVSRLICFVKPLP